MIVPANSAQPSIPQQLPGRARALDGVENAALAVVFALTVVLPIAEIALRATLGIGIDGVSALVQHLTLALGMIGAAVAAREERLLSLAVVTMLKGRAASMARFASGAISAAVAALLAFAAADFVAI